MAAASVCIFGDSVAKGVVFDQVRQRYALLKNGFVNLACAALRLSPKNYSKFGCTVTKGAEMLGAHAAELAQYDWTLLEFGGNDSDFDWAGIAAEPDAPHQPKTPPAEFAAQYGGMIETVLANGGTPVLLNLPPVEPQRFFDWVSRGLNAENILHWLGGRVDYIYRWHESYSMEISRLAQRYNLPLIDIRTAFLQRHRYEELLCADGMHPNEQGHALISDEIQARAARYALANRG